jgi:hypothetical protein
MGWHFEIWGHEWKLESDSKYNIAKHMKAKYW